MGPFKEFYENFTNKSTIKYKINLINFIKYL